MGERDVFIVTDEAVKGVVDQIRDNQWDGAAAAEMTVS